MSYLNLSLALVVTKDFGNEANADHTVGAAFGISQAAPEPLTALDRGIKMKILAFLSALLFSATTLADDHQDSGPYYAFFHMQVADPAAVVDSMDRFWASDCGKQYPADVALSQEVFNGGYTSTHFIINTFQNSADQAKAAELMRTCASSIQFLQELAAAGTIPTTQYMGPAAVDENDWGQDSAFSKFDIIVEPQDQAAYAAAYGKMMKEAAKDIDLRSYGLGAVYFGRDKFTHWVWTGGRSIPEVNAISEQLIAHPAFAEFNEAVGDMRTVVNTSQIQILKGYARQ